jgi:hypothetical protein
VRQQLLFSLSVAVVVAAVAHNSPAERHAVAVVVAAVARQLGARFESPILAEASRSRLVVRGLLVRP